MTVYCAPAARAFTVAHIRDTNVPPGDRPEPHTGRTRCGLDMCVTDLWLGVDLRQGDKICGACRGETGEQGAMW